MTKTTPPPVLRLLHQTSLNRVAVDVADLLHEFLTRQDIEVVIPRLPKLSPFAFQHLGGLALKDTKCGAKRLRLRFAKKKVNVLRHEHISEKRELMALPKLLKCLYKSDACVIFVEVGEPPVTTKRDEVIVSFSLITFQTARHKLIVKPQTPRSRIARRNVGCRNGCRVPHSSRSYRDGWGRFHSADPGSTPVHHTSPILTIIKWGLATFSGVPSLVNVTVATYVLPDLAGNLPRNLTMWSFVN